MSKFILNEKTQTEVDFNITSLFFDRRHNNSDTKLQRISLITYSNIMIFHFASLKNDMQVNTEISEY
jgi:hypothetical protein